MFCSECGFKCTENARFCGRCGASLASADQPEAQTAYQPVVQPAYQPVVQPLTLFMKPKTSFINYVFDVLDENGNLVYKAETQAQGMHYGAHICDAYGRELISIRHGSKAALVTMMFDVYRDGALIGHVNQKVEKARYVYDFPELGFFNESDTYACNLHISNDGYPAATAVKKKKSMTDKYTVTVNDSRDADVVLALIMIVQLSLMRSRRGNSRI